MDIRPIKTKSDYRAALKEVERLWEAEPGTPDGDRVDVLVTLIVRLTRRSTFRSPRPTRSPRLNS